MSKELSVADYHWTANCTNFFFGNSFEDDFGTDASRVSHGDADARPRRHKLSRNLLPSIHQANSPARLERSSRRATIKIQWREASYLRRASSAACARRLCK